MTRTLHQIVDTRSRPRPALLCAAIISLALALTPSLLSAQAPEPPASSGSAVVRTSPAPVPAGSRLAPAKATNLIPDPGFEETTSSWTTWSESSFPGTSLWEGSWGIATPRSGSSAFAISNLVYGSVYTEPITIQPSTLYHLSSLVQGEIDPDESPAGIIIRASFYDSSDTAIGHSDAVPTTSTVSDTWQRMAGDITTPSNAATLRINLYNLMTSGWVAFDDVELIESGTSTNLAPDPGFEQSPSAWIAWAHTPFPATSHWRGNWGPAAGNGYAHVISNHAYSKLESERVTVLPSTDYDLYAWFKGEVDIDGSYSGLLIRVYLYNAAGSQISFTDVHLDSAFNAASFESRGGRFTTPADTATLDFVIYTYLATGWVAVDDVELIEVGGSTNLLGDPGFELDNGSWSDISLSSWPASGIWRNTWGPIRSGSAAQVLGNLAFGAVSSAQVPVTGSTGYDLEVWARGAIDAEDTLSGANIRVLHRNSSGQIVQTDVLETWLPQSATWQEHSYNLFTPADATSLQVSLYGILTNGWVAYDDIELSVRPPLAVEALPQQRYAELGSSVTLQCSAHDGLQPYSFRWRYSTNGVSYSDLSDTARLSGTGTPTLEISDVQAADEGLYLCRVTDSEQVPSVVDSTPSQLDVMSVQPESCTPFDPAPGDFSTAAGLSEWSATFNGPTGWSYDATYQAAHLETTSASLPYRPGVYGLLERQAVVIPRTYDKLRVSFAYLDENLGHSLRLRWNGGSVDLSVDEIGSPPYETTVELSAVATWHDGSDIDGYYTRDLELEFLTESRVGKLSRIDFLPAPNLILESAPALMVDVSLEPRVPHSYAVGRVFELNQEITNRGCDLESITAHLDHRPVVFTLCKVGGPCWNDGFSCTNSDPEAPNNVASVQGEILGNETESQLLGTLTMPTAEQLQTQLGITPDLSGSFGLWQVQAQLVNEPEKVSPALELELVLNGTPNLALVQSVPAQALVGVAPDTTRTGWLVKNQPATIYLPLRSEEYDAANVTVDLLARASEPGESPYTDWVLIARDVIAQVTDGSGVSIDNVVIGNELLPANIELALLDLRIVADPFGLISEFWEHDNSMEIPAWIPVGQDPMDEAFADPVPGLVDTFDGSGDLGLPSAQSWMFTNMEGGELVVRHENQSPPPGEPPYVWWTVSSADPITGLVIRLRDVEDESFTAALAGAGLGAHDPYRAPNPDPSPDLGSSSQTFDADGQWHTLIWRVGQEEPFGAYPNLGQLTSIVQTGADSQTLYLGIDPWCGQTWCPTKIIDLVRAWRESAEPPPPGSLSAEGFRYSIDGGQSYSVVDPANPPLVDPGTDVYLQAIVESGTADISGPVTLTATGTLTYADATVVNLSGQTTEPAILAGTTLYIALGSEYLEVRPGLAELTFDLAATAGVVTDQTATAWLDVAVISTDCLDPPPSFSGSFDDVPLGHPARVEIEYIASQRIMGGCGGAYFCPDSPVTREEIAVFMEVLMRGISFAPPQAAGIFSDVPPEYCHACWIEQLYADGIAPECAPDTFCPYRAVTRAEASVLLLGARQFVARDWQCCPPPITCQGTFTDVPCDYPSRAYIEKLHELGIDTGCGGGSFCPERHITRADLAVLIYATLGTIP